MIIDADLLGMFLYARLVCDSIGTLGDVESIRDAVDDLPDGLNEASVPPISLRVASTNRHTAMIESFTGLPMAWKYANAMMLGRFWRLSLAVQCRLARPKFNLPCTPLTAEIHRRDVWGYS